LTEPVGLRPSSLSSSLTLVFEQMRATSTSGVWPIASISD
jgi:hypothetical protein